MSALEDWGLLPLSYSTIKNFKENPANWYLSKILKIPFTTNPSIERGHAVEKGIEVALRQQDIKDGRRFGCQEFDKRIIDNNLGGDKAREERAVIEPLIDLGYKTISALGTLISFQSKIDINIQTDVGDVSLIGYTDFEIETPEGDRILIDLKTKGKKVSTPTDSEYMQQNIYAKATNCQTALLYLSNTKKNGATKQYFEVEHTARYITEVIRVIETMDRLLSSAKDKKDLAKFIVPNTDDWTWNEPIKNQARKDVWGY